MRVAILLMVLLSTVAYAAATDLVSEYDVSINLKADGTAHVTKKVMLKNTAEDVIVPGEGKIQLSTLQDELIGFVPTGRRISKFQEIYDLTVRDLDGGWIKSKADFHKEKTVISYDIWTPLQKGENVSFLISYDTPDLTGQGILFTPVVVPSISGSVPIERYTVSLTWPESMHLTYPSSLKPVANTLTTSTPESLVLELSRIPFPAMPMRTSTVLWLLIIGMILVALWISIKVIRDVSVELSRFYDGTRFKMVTAKAENIGKRVFKGNVLVQLFEKSGAPVFTDKKNIVLQPKSDASVQFRFKPSQTWNAGEYVLKLSLMAHGTQITSWTGTVEI